MFRSVLFLLFQLTPLLAFVSGVSTGAILFAMLVYSICMFGVTAGYHRYFSHRAFKTSRVFQFILAVMGSLSLQKGVLWWAAGHRDHHRYSDKEKDLHSPVQGGFWWAHMGWILSEKHLGTNEKRIKDLIKFPELKWIDQFWFVPYFILCAFTLAVFGFQYLVWGCFIAIFLSMHATFCVNSINHLIGDKPYKTSDESRNIFWLALPTFGEAFHCNHHYYSASARQGFKWYQIDLAYIILRALEKLKIVWSLHCPPDKVINDPDKLN